MQFSEQRKTLLHVKMQTLRCFLAGSTIFHEKDFTIVQKYVEQIKLQSLGMFVQVNQHKITGCE